MKVLEILLVAHLHKDKDTSDFQYKIKSYHLQKYSDDSVVVGCISGVQENWWITLWRGVGMIISS